MSTKDGFDDKKRWGNSGMRGHGVNSSAMMEARKNMQTPIQKAIHAKKEEKGEFGKGKLLFKSKGFDKAEKEYNEKRNK